MTTTYWKWCTGCGMLVRDYLAPCTMGDRHSTSLQQFLVLRADEPDAPGQHGWRHCTACRALVHGTGGVCPATHGAHTVDAVDFAVPHTSSSDPHLGDGVVGQQEWRWCSKCHGLYRGTRKCPAGDWHGGAPSGRYGIPTGAQPLVIRTPVRRLLLSSTGLDLEFDWAAARGNDGSALAPGQGAWVARARAPGVGLLRFFLVQGSVEASFDLAQKRALLTQLNQHVLTPGLSLTLHAFDNFDSATWDDNSPAIEIRRLT